MNPTTPRPRILTVLILASVLTLLGVGGLVFLRPARPVTAQRPAAAPEVLRAELRLREGRLYHGAESNAFNGWMLERYGSGALKSRSAIAHGLLHGLSEGWHTNGLIQIREQFRAGTSHGPRTKYYPDGRKLSEAMVVEGKLEGVFQKWHSNGQLSERVELSGGVPHGNSKSYFPSGSLKTKARMEQGEVVETQSWGDGEFQVSTASVATP